jgi:uncharacterized protein (DUF924 family)
VSPDDLLHFWFSPASRARWFDSTPGFDRLVAERFLPLWESAARGELAPWEASDEGALALTIVLDQLPLHLFRGRAEAFATEAAARAVARRALARGADRRVAPERRGFFYLPFMHSESLADQDLAVALYEDAGLEEGLRWARHHRELIRRFGRFPHRNTALGRDSTPAERDYLQSAEAFRG